MRDRSKGQSRCRNAIVTAEVSCGECHKSALVGKTTSLLIASAFWQTPSHWQKTSHSSNETPRLYSLHASQVDA